MSERVKSTRRRVLYDPAAENCYVRLAIQANRRESPNFRKRGHTKLYTSYGEKERF